MSIEFNEQDNLISLFNEWQSSNAFLPIDFTDDGIDFNVKELQPQKAFFPNLVRDEGSSNFICFNDEQSLKAEDLIKVILGGIVISVNE